MLVSASPDSSPISNAFLHFSHSLIIAAPFWEAAHSLEELQIAGSFQLTRANVEEQDEGSMTSFELPAELPTSSEAIQTLHNSIISRAIVTAAKGGRLKYLFVVAELPFAVRSLLPHWVSIVQWNSHRMELGEDDGPPRGWRGAARQLRPLLAHVSMQQGPRPRSFRLLTRHDVEALESSDYFQMAWPTQTKVPDNSDSEDEEVDLIFPSASLHQRLGQYLLWLRQDAELASRVADAWNAVVERGEANLGSCVCSRCV